VCLAILALAGAARVTFAAQAAEASIDAWELKAEVKAERLAERALKADRSALAAPSRIEAVACQTLNMGRPAEVAYLQLPAEQATGPDAAVAEAAHGPSGGAELLATLMDLAAGEAEVMLVGDVGLGSFR
jgi:cell division protein FtsL